MFADQAVKQDECRHRGEERKQLEQLDFRESSVAEKERLSGQIIKGRMEGLAELRRVRQGAVRPDVLDDLDMVVVVEGVLIGENKKAEADSDEQDEFEPALLSVRFHRVDKEY